MGNEFKIGTIVSNKKTGKTGVVVENLWDCCEGNEVPVVYDETDYFAGTIKENLERIGKYDNNCADEKCGLGAGEQTCRYLGMAAGRLICQRFSDSRYPIIFSETEAQGSPRGLYPKCQAEIQADIRSGKSVAGLRRKREAVKRKEGDLALKAWLDRIQSGRANSD